MTDILTRRLRENKKQTSCIGLGITYSKEYNSGFYHTTKLDIKTDDTDIILNTFFLLFDKYYNNLPIRKVTLCLSSLSKKDNVQLNLFENINDLNKKDSINSSIDSIKSKFGKNSLVKATALLEDSTALERNKKIGGMINRDIIKWQPFDSLVSSQKMINSIVNEKAKINKPILSSDQLNQLNDLIIEYFYEQINIIIKYYKNNNIYKTAGIIIDLNQSTVGVRGSNPLFSTKLDFNSKFE